MADGGRYRRRSHATFSMTPDRIEINAQRPHYQSRESNTLNGGVDRWFDIVSMEVSDGAVITEILGVCRSLLGRLEARSASESLFVEMHQFRTEPSPLGTAKPTPEGMHRDGVNWVCIFLVDKLNIKYGTTRIANNNGLCVGRVNLDHALDAVFIDDRRVKHYVTPIRRIISPSPGHRDVLVLTFDKR